MRATRILIPTPLEGGGEEHDIGGYLECSSEVEGEGAYQDDYAVDYANELLLNEEDDTEGVNMSAMFDPFQMSDDCIRAVVNERGMKLTVREATRLELTMVDFCGRCDDAISGRLNWKEYDRVEPDGPTVFRIGF